MDGPEGSFPEDLNGAGWDRGEGAHVTGALLDKTLKISRLGLAFEVILVF